MACRGLGRGYRRKGGYSLEGVLAMETPPKIHANFLRVVEWRAMEGLCGRQRAVTCPRARLHGPQGRAGCRPCAEASGPPLSHAAPPAAHAPWVADGWAPPPTWGDAPGGPWRDAEATAAVAWAGTPPSDPPATELGGVAWHRGCAPVRRRAKRDAGEAPMRPAGRRGRSRRRKMAAAKQLWPPRRRRRRRQQRRPTTIRRRGRRCGQREVPAASAAPLPPRPPAGQSF